jgi:hypothetical protein
MEPNRGEEGLIMATAFIIIGIVLCVIAALCCVIFCMAGSMADQAADDIDFTREVWRNPPRY